MGEAGMLLIKALVLGMVLTGFGGFLFIRYMQKHTDGAVHRLDRETEQVRAKQIELNEKIKLANEELATRRKEADALVAKMSEDAEEKGREEREKIIKKAREEAEEIISKAQRTKDEIRRSLEQEMKVKAVDFSVLMLEEFLSRQSIGLLDENLIAEFLKDLEGVDTEVIAKDVDTTDIMTVRPLPEPTQRKFADLLTKKLGRPIKINNILDDKMVGGILLRFGNLSLDGSIKSVLMTKAEQIKDKLVKGLLS